MKNRILIFLFCTVGTAYHLCGQFTQVEFFKSLDKSNFYLYSSQSINASNSLQLSTLSFYENHRSTENQGFSEAGMQPTLFWNFHKRFAIGPSIYYNSISGLAQRISTRFISKTERLLIVLIPTIGHYERTEKTYGETFVQFQYNIPIAKSLSFWVNGQFLNVWNAFKTHSRSFQQLRIGISLNKHQFGWGLDIDHYGYEYLTTCNIGFYYKRIF